MRRKRAGTSTEGAGPSAFGPRKGFAPLLVRWQREHGRHHLPWQKTQAALRAEGVVLPYPVQGDGEPAGALKGDVVPAVGRKGRGATRDDSGAGRGPRRGSGGGSGSDSGGGSGSGPDNGSGSGSVSAACLADVLRDPYRVWLSEVMLQQTQVTTVIPYFEAFLQAFPQVTDLAAAPSEQVMGLWAGLGYYSRARNLHAAAKMVAAQGGVFPDSAGALQALPGVGRSTAAAIAAFGFGAREPILDGNVKRVLCRVFAVEGDPAGTAVQKRLWTLAGEELPEARGQDTAGARLALAEDMVAYTQGMMDLGAMVCTRTKPDCGQCPVSRHCQAYQQGAVERYPTPRARKAQPVRQVNLLWLQDGEGQVLLEARPEKGLWGGLWSLPELPQVLPALPQLPQLPPPSQALTGRAQVPSDARQKASAAQEEAAGVPVGWLQVGRFEHVFTHFRMQATLWTPVEPGSDGLPLFGGRFPAEEGKKKLRLSPEQRLEALGLMPAPERQRRVSAAGAEGAPLPAPILRCIRMLLG